MHLIVRLESAKLCDPPSFEPQAKTPLQQQGLTYERKIVRVLKSLYADTCEILHGQWFQYIDASGTRFAQPDVILLPKDKTKPIIVVEVKLTWSKLGKVKLGCNYARLVKTVYARPVVQVQICKRIRRGCTDKTFADIDKLLELDKKYACCTYV